MRELELGEGFGMKKELEKSWEIWPEGLNVPTWNCKLTYTYWQEGSTTDFTGGTARPLAISRGRSGKKTIMVCVTTSEVFVNQKIAKRDKCESRLGVIEMQDIKDSIELAAT
jgi:hypothetical protein